MNELRQRIERRLAQAGSAASDTQLDQLAAYLSLLQRWNTRMNLTALGDPDLAVDRLIVEPVLAASAIDADARLLVDVGSGGGSPAVPLNVMRPHLRLVMIEIRTRKAVFLREAARHAGLADVSVENATFEDVLATPTMKGSVDVVSVRAVRAEREQLELFGESLRPTGQQLWFLGSAQALPSMPTPLTIERDFPLVPALKSRLVVIRKA